MPGDPADVELADEDRPGLSALFAHQGRAAARNGSPLYADLCRSASLDLASGGRLAQILGPWDGARFGDIVPLRVLGTAHRLVLERAAPALAVWFPSVGGTAPVDDAGRAACFRAWTDALDEHRDRLADLIGRVPQTNDIGRAAGLLGAFHHVAAAYGLPLRLHELGTSAGFLLRSDQVRVRWLGGTAGPSGSPVVLDDAWVGEPLPPTQAHVDVAERVGVDLAPVDVATTEGRLHLTSYVWPDQLERFERLRAAFELAERVPVELVRGDLVHHLASLHPQPGTALVVQHSAVWPYLPEPVKDTALAQIARLGAEASPHAPVVHLAREFLGRAHGVETAIVARCWPAPEAFRGIGADDGDPVLLADTPAHGLPVRWLPPRVLATG